MVNSSENKKLLDEQLVEPLENLHRVDDRKFYWSNWK